MSLRKSAALFAAALGLLMTTTTADAAFSLRIDDGVNPVVQIDDGGVGDDDGLVNGEIDAAGIFGDFDLDVEFVESNAPGGSISILTNLVKLERIDDLGTGLLILTASATDYVSNLVDNVLNSDVTTNTIVGDVSVVFQSWADPGNTQFETGVGTTTTGPQGPLTVLATDEKSTEFDDPDKTFSLTNELRITASYDSNSNRTGQAQVTVDTNVNPVPEPGTMALLALGGVGLAGARWRRRKAT